MKRNLITALLALSLAGCNAGSNAPATYTTYELDRAVTYAATCIGTTPPDSYHFVSSLPTVQGLKTWGNYNWKTGVMQISAELDYTKQESDLNRKLYENYLITVVSHELAHRLQSKTYWAISPANIPWADRPEEQNAQLLAGVCLTKFLLNNRSYAQ